MKPSSGNYIELISDKFHYFSLKIQKQLLVYMPNVSALTTEAFTLFAMNRTYDWLKSKSPAEQREIVNNHGRMSNRFTKSTNKGRQKSLKFVVRIWKPSVNKRKNLRKPGWRI